MESAQVWIDTPPKGQPRPRVFQRGGKAMTFTPPVAAEWKKEIREKFEIALAGRNVAGPVKVWCLFAVKNPLARPDGDNIEKAVLDSLIDFFDDAKVVFSQWEKVANMGQSYIKVEWNG